MSRQRSEASYLELLDEVLTYGQLRKNRTGTDTLSLFGPQLRIDLRNGFPLFTTKKVWFKGVAVELDWMLQGTGNIEYLQRHGVKIWDAWAKADFRPQLGYSEGELGPVYGVQWRRWPIWQQYDPDVEDSYGFKHDDDQAHRAGYIDQIAQIVAQLRRRASGEVHSDDRRILLNAWNVAEIDRMKLPPCHYGAQFLVDNDLGLTTIVSIRSWDLFLGAPFNIAQYALLTHLLSQVCGLHPADLIFNAGDAHIYVNHREQVTEQLSREPKDAPSLLMSGEIKEIDDFRWDRVLILGYDHHPPIKGDVAV